MRPIDKAIEATGGQAELARRVGVTLQAVYQWHKGTRPVPPGRCIPIEQATGGQVTRYELRSDVFGPPPWRVIPVKNAEGARVDPEDFERISALTWYAVRRGRSTGGQKTYAEAMRDGRPIMMHRLILEGAATGHVIDHINGDGLDNRRINLRVCTQRENSRNRIGRVGRQQHKGVAFRKDIGKWRARIMVDRQEISLGVYDSEAEAAEAYNAAAIEHFGEFARPNIVNTSSETGNESRSAIDDGECDCPRKSEASA